MRRKAPSSSSYARATRMATAVAASDSMARSASTLRISGWSASSLPKALRCLAWCMAWATPQRIPADDPIRQSRRVWLTIRMIVRTPRPSSPTSWPRTPWNSTSLDGSERVPSLSFSRWMRKPGSRPSIRKQERPPGACASVRNTSQGGYEQNHLWPVISHASPFGTARVEFARTSEPPCFSVIAIPTSAPSS
jgi:hypothetical protein